jgi:hypothetical protein
MTALFLISVIFMFALWIAVFFFSKQERHASKALMFYLGTFLVWPVLAFISSFLLIDALTAGNYDSITRAVLGLNILVGTAATTLLIWLSGWWAARFVAWKIRK